MADSFLRYLCCVLTVPDMLPSVQVDRGAIKFVLSGANVMSPGLTSAGGRLPDPSKGEEPLKKGQCVAIRAQGKEEILAVGVLQMDTEEVRKTGKGIAIENIHYLGGEFRDTVIKASCYDTSMLTSISTSAAVSVSFCPRGWVL